MSRAGAHPLLAVLLFNLAVVIFALMDTTTQYLTRHFEPPLVMGVRYVGNLLMLLAFFAPRGFAGLARTRRTGLVWARGLCLASGSICIAMALRTIPVAEATAIMFMAPMLIVLAAGPLLGERIGRVEWLAAICGFLGVVLIARPGSGLDPTGVIFALCTVLAITCYQLLSRVLASTEQTSALIFYATLVGSLIFGSSAPLFLPSEMPTAWEICLFVMLAAFGGIGHYLLTAAFRVGTASLLAPMNYLQLCWALLFGWLAFGHIPDALSMIGMAIVATSGVAVALHARSRRAVSTAD